MPETPAPSVDASLLMKLRLVVARFGEMDGAGWWNTRGILGRIGKAGLSRGFPSTHYFAQARIAFAVAGARCTEIFNPPACYNLWTMPPEIEELVDAHWQAWCRAPSEWEIFFGKISETQAGDLLDRLIEMKLANASVRASVASLQVSAQGKAVQLPQIGYPDTESVLLLAAAFARGAKGQLTVPYMRAE
jgi:hypothetical protein